MVEYSRPALWQDKDAEPTLRPGWLPTAGACNWQGVLWQPGQHSLQLVKQSVLQACYELQPQNFEQ